MSPFRVRLRNPEVRFWSNQHARYITGDEVLLIQDPRTFVFWKRRIKAGEFEIVADEAPKADEPQQSKSQPQPQPVYSRRRGKNRGRTVTQPSPPPPTLESTTVTDDEE